MDLKSAVISKSGFKSRSGYDAAYGISCCNKILIKMSHWHHAMVDGAEFWITCKGLKLLRKTVRLQLIQNSAPSTILWRQCDIPINMNLIGFGIDLENSKTQIFENYALKLDLVQFFVDHVQYYLNVSKYFWLALSRLKYVNIYGLNFSFVKKYMAKKWLERVGKRPFIRRKFWFTVSR